MTKSEFLRQLSGAISADELMKLLVDTILEMLPDEPTSEVPQESTATVDSLNVHEMANYFRVDSTPIVTVFKPVVSSTIADIYTAVEACGGEVENLVVHPSTLGEMDFGLIAEPVVIHSLLKHGAKLHVWGSLVSVSESVPTNKIYILSTDNDQYHAEIK